MEISVVVPVFNGEKTLNELNGKIKQALEGRYDYEVIFVHDHGKDKSPEVIRKLESENNGLVRGFSLEKNMGQHNAILFGIGKALGEFIVTLDEDLQHDPAYIARMKERQREGDFDVVYARFMKLNHQGVRIWLSEMLRVVLRRIVPDLYPDYSPYRLIRRETANKILSIRRPYTFIDGYLGMVTRNFGIIDAEHYRRADGRSSYSYYKLIRHAVMIAISYSPLFNGGRRNRY